MIFFAIVTSFLVFLFDIFFIPGLFLPFRLSFSLLGLVLLLLWRQERPALVLALLSGFLIDLTAPFSFFGASLIWHFVIYLLASKLLFSFFTAARRSSVAIFGFLVAFLYYFGGEIIILLHHYVSGKEVVFPIFSLTAEVALSALFFSLLIFIFRALLSGWQRLLRRWFLIR